MRAIIFLPHLIALIITAWTVYFAWKRKITWGIGLFIWYVSGHLLWILGLILETSNASLEMKLFWHTFQWAVVLISTPAFPVFALLYKNKDFDLYKPALKLVIGVSYILLVLTLTNSVHGHLYNDPHIIRKAGVDILSDRPSPLVYTLIFYSFAIFLSGISILLQGTFKKTYIHREQTLLFVLGFILPAIGSLLDIAGFQPFFGQSNLPVAFALGNTLNAWNLARYNIFRISPANRNEAFEAMMDPVVILDNNNIIIDINRSMLDLLGEDSNTVIGKSAKLVFDNFPIPIKLYSSVSYARTETEFSISGRTVHYEMSVWPILNPNLEVVSRLYISHDITALKELEMELRRLNDKLETRVKERTQELANSYDYTLEGWARALELRDKETEGHSRRVTEATLKVVRALDLPEDEVEHIRRGAILHDIGKMAIPDSILLKPGKLTPEERKFMEKHPTIAYQLLERIPYLARAMDIPYCHHERWDGKGYPRGLKKYEIPIAARIFAIADVWDALRSDRPYSEGWKREDAVAYLVEQAGSHFDPRIVNIFLGLVEQGQIQ